MMPDKKNLAFEKSRHEFRFIRDLQVHPVVQRRLDLGWAKKIAANLDPDMLGELAVAEDGGRLLVFDGQHRLWACRTVLGEDQKIPCRIYHELSLERQADLFLGTNSFKTPRATDKWRQAVVAKHETELKIEAVLARHHLKVSDGPANGGVRAVAALKEVYLRYGGEQGVERVVSILTKAWNRDPESYDGTFLRAIGLLAHRFGQNLDDEDLTRKLARSGGPGRMLGHARDFAKAAGISLNRAMADRILTVYNKGRRKDLLSLAKAA